MDSLEIERISQHGSPCGLRHPSPCRPELAVLRQLPAGPADQALDGGLCQGPLSQLSQLRVGPALPSRSMGWSVALDGGVSVGVGVSDGVMGTGGGCGPGQVLVVLSCGGAWRAGTRAYAEAWVCGQGLCFAVGLGSAGAAVAGHVLEFWADIGGW